MKECFGRFATRTCARRWGRGSRAGRQRERVPRKGDSLPGLPGGASTLRRSADALLLHDDSRWNLEAWHPSLHREIDGERLRLLRLFLLRTVSANDDSCLQPDVGICEKLYAVDAAEPDQQDSARPPPDCIRPHQRFPGLLDPSTDACGAVSLVVSQSASLAGSYD